jgi:hypothetical protein
MTRLEECLVGEPIELAGARIPLDLLVEPLRVE